MDYSIPPFIHPYIYFCSSCSTTSARSTISIHPSISSIANRLYKLTDRTACSHLVLCCLELLTSSCFLFSPVSSNHLSHLFRTASLKIILYVCCLVFVLAYNHPNTTSAAAMRLRPLRAFQWCGMECCTGTSSALSVCVVDGVASLR